tara:strand:+ start:538 stop:1635 length:1098 start_codon:yes stop_codon:yes gene_type:complete
MFLIVTRNFPPDVGGMQVLMGGLSKNFLDHGPVKVFANEFPNADSHDANQSMSIERIKGIKLFRKYRKANIVNNFINQNSNIRAVITDHWKSLELLKTEYLNKTKTFCLLHSKEINHPVGSLINKRIIKSTNKANFIIANSNFTKNLAVKVGIDEKKIYVIFPGIEKPIKIDKKFKIEAENIFKDCFPKIITVARLDKRKGHDKILMTIKNLKNRFPKIKYVSVGFGEEENNLKRLANHLSLNKEVVFLKNLDENLKLALIENSNLFLMPSRIEKKSVEGFGISFIEAASYGIASIGGKDGGASDAIHHNKTGLICDGNDLSSIYNSILLFFDNNNFNKFGKAALELSEDFYWKKVIKKYLKLIN